MVERPSPRVTRTDFFIKDLYHCIGSSTINRGILHSISGLLEMIKGLRFRGKSAAAFGSYGWSGESVAYISKMLADSGFTVLDEGIKAAWMPDTDVLSKCEAYGRSIAGKQQHEGDGH